MKIKLIFSTFLLFIFILINIFIGCKGEQGPVGPEGPSKKGDIIGFIKIIDYNGNSISDASGTTVSLENTQNTTITETSGKFSFNNITIGTYDLKITRPNYPIHKIISFPHLGGNATNLGVINYYQIPLFTISSFIITSSSSSISVSGTITGQLPTTTRYIRLFADYTSNVSNNPANYIFTILISTSTPTSTSFSTSIPTSVLRNYGINQGIPLYFKAYPEAYMGGNSYIDLITGKYFYVSVNPISSNIIAVISP